ncbi:MAG: uracil-DNA glycosylase [Thermoplasmata archaeon]|nr:MAG: uracil-DNA glycosylase [Thermoplasmata archaeon]
MSKRKKIENLNIEIRNCRRCRLSQTRTNVVLGEGDINSRIMIVAQAPGENEDKEGRMFIGPSGKVLDELFEHAGIRRKDVYMTNLIKCKLPKYRKPKRDEIESCSPYLDREIEIIQPDMIVTLGYFASSYILEKYLIEESQDFRQVYGRAFYTKSGKIVLPLRHPAALLYNPELEESMMEDYRKVGIVMEGLR